MGGGVPTGTLHEHSVDERTIFWFLINLSNGDLIPDLEFKAQLIDSDDLLSCEILQGGCEEGLREEETGDPEYWGCLLFTIDPLVQKYNSL